jgi:transposase
LERGEGLDRRILNLLRHSNKGLTAKEIAKILNEPLDTVYKALSRLQERGYVAPIDTIKGGRGRPEHVFALSEVEVEWGDVVRADDVEKKGIVEEQDSGLVLEVVESAILPGYDVKEKIRAAAQELRTKNPRDLLFKMAEWLIKRYRELGEEYKSAYKSGRIHVANIIREKMEKIKEFAFKLYNKQLGVPWDRGDKTGRKGPFILYYDFRNCMDESYLDREGLKKFLELHVHGDTVLQKVRLGNIQTPTLAGTDASCQEIRLLNYAPQDIVILRAPIGIVVAVRAFYSPGKPPRIEAKPEPREWRRYTMEDAARKGLMVPPNVYLNDPDMWKRAVEAAMNLRQYVNDYEVLFPEPSEPGVWIVEALFRDGRIFPWEHYFSDFVRLGEHGRFVRYCLDKFHELLGRLNNARGRKLYCGAVKEPHVAVLTPLVLWYMRYGTPNPLWPELEEENVLSGYMLSDQQMASLLFEAVRNECTSDERWVTFQVVRRFYTLAEDTYSRLWVEGSWYDVFKEAVRERNEKGLPTFDDPSTYADLCDGAAILWFYIDTGLQQSLSPRYEVLLPSWALQDVNALCSVVREVVQRLVSLVAYPGVTTPYPEVWGGLSDQEELKYVLLMPTPTCLAHESAATVCKDHAQQLEAYLTVQLIKEIARLRKARLQNP